MSWTWDREKEGDYEEYNVSSHFDLDRRVVYTSPNWATAIKEFLINHRDE